MKRVSPTTQITLALVFLTCAILVTANLLFGVFQDPGAAIDTQRKALGESLAAQAAALLQAGERKSLEIALASAQKQDPTIRSLALRHADRSIVVQTGDHAKAWAEGDGAVSGATRIEVPLLRGSERWGSFEMTYFPERRSALARVLSDPLWVTLLFAAAAGMALYRIYMRRALIHLDPASVIPERIKQAFDVMTEAVVVLDRRGRILLANNAFHKLHAGAEADPTGKPLSALFWLAPGLERDPAQHPWWRAMQDAVPVISHPVEIGESDGKLHKLKVNCAPIRDASEQVRGCLVTFDDLTDLHLANERLFKTLEELSASKSEIEQKNSELEHLGTHDPLSGCLTRRAFFERMERARDEARRNGTPLSCFVLDIDHFKSVNDALGHVTGDRVIQEVGAQLAAALRVTDIVSRFGGDEFLAGMPGCSLHEAVGIATKISRTIQSHFRAAIGGPQVTVSIGVAVLDPRDRQLTDLIQRADKALYDAKSLGRNRVAQQGSGDASPVSPGRAAAVTAAK
jgi:diguanylate cyclase (GGDEF)-like protein/PAS domain S-box-containing protein